MKTMRKPILLIAVTLAAAVCIVLLSTLFWIKSNHGLQWVQSRINTTIPGKITIEAHRLSLLGPSLDLYGVSLHDPQGLALAGFTHLSVGLDWWALWRREIRLESILLQDPWTDLAVDEAAGLNLMTALMPPAEQKKPVTTTPDSDGLPFNIVCESIQLTDGRFTFTPSDDTIRLEATGITLGADGNLMARSGNLELVVDSVRFSSDATRPQPARITLKARLDGDELRISALDVISGQTTLRFSGSANDLYDTPKIDSDLSVDSRLAELKSIFNLAGDYGGPVNAKLSLKGPVANPDARLVLTVGNGRIAGQPLDRGDLSIGLKDRQLTIEPASLRLADGTLALNGTVNLREAFPAGFLTPPDDTHTIAYHLNLVPDIPDLSPWLQGFVDISGATTGRISLSGNGVIPSEISARLTIKGSGQNLLAPGMAQPINADVNLSAQMDHGTIAIPRLDADADGVELFGDGRYQMNDGALAGNLSLTADDLSRVLAVAGIPSVNGACSAALTVDGSLSRPQFWLNLTSNNLKVDTYTLGDIIVEASMDHNGRLDLTTLNLKNQDSRIEGHGRLRLLADGGGIDSTFGNSLELVLKNVSAADFMPAPPIDGTLSGRLRLDGQLESLTGKLSLNAAALKADTATIGDVVTRLRLENGTIIVDRLHLQNRDSTLTATGNIQLLTPGTLSPLQDPTFKFSAGSDHFDPGHFVDMASGDFTFNSEVTGSFKTPVGVVTLAGRQAILAGQPVETLSLDARFADQRLWIDRLIASAAPGEQIAGSGWLGLDKTLDLRLKTDGIAISRVQQLHDLFPGDGVLRASVSAQGRMENPDIDGQLTVSDIIVNQEVLEDFNLTFSLHDMQAKATGNLNFEIDAACDLRQGDVDAHLIFNRTETAAYFKAAGRPGFNGTLTGRVQAKGNIHDAANASVQVDLSALHLRFEEISLVQSDRISLQLAERKLSISDFTVALLSEGHLRLQGNASIGGHLDMAVDGRVPLAAAGVFSDELKNATGVIGLAGDISGEMTAPQFDARIDLENVGIPVPGLVQQLRNLSGSIHLTPDSIRIDSVEGFMGTGRIVVAGTIDHDHFEPVGIDLSINARSVPLEVPDTLAVRVNSNIQIKGKNRSAKARGEIILLEGVYDKDVNINLLQIASTATTRQRTVAPATKPMTIPYFDTVDLNIVIGHRQPFAVENNVAQLDIRPDLKINGTLANPIVSGRAQVRDGTVTFQRRNFDVKRGIIDFVNPYRTEAEIDIESEAEIRTWRINLSIKGTLDNLNITLTSVPTETEADILSLILFGRTARELTAGEGGSQRTTSQIMADMLADTLGDDLKKRTGVDILQLETTDGIDQQDTGGIKVTVGKHLSDRMTVKYAIETINGETQQWAIMEYKLLERILVNGSQSSAGLFGAELVYRIEFR
jgi:translocation and assembly module TamB